MLCTAIFGAVKLDRSPGMVTHTVAGIAEAVLRTANLVKAGTLSREEILWGREGVPVELRLTVQRATRLAGLPGNAMFRRWVGAALAGAGHRSASELVIRLVNAAEGRRLNLRWRRRDYATNVLSFPAGLPSELHSALLGDLVICAPVVRREARLQEKPLIAHWAHLTVHGTLHLLGYDHETPEQAGVMEPLETSILGRLGFPDPYAPA